MNENPESEPVQAPAPVESVSSAPQYPAPKRSGGKSRVAVIILGILGVIAILLIAVSFVRIDGDSLWHRAYAVWQLQGIQVAEGFAASVEPYVFGMNGLKPYAVAGVNDGEIMGDYASAAGVTAAVLRADVEDPGQVYLLGENRRALTEYEGTKALVDVSPDGNFVAFSVATSTDKGRLSAWTLHLYDISEGTDTDLGTGFGAQFFERDGKTWLLSTSADGVSVTDVETLQGFTTTSFEFLDDLSFVALISPDGSHIALRDAALQDFGLYEVYRLGSNVPLGIRPLPADLSEFADVTLREGAVYGMSAVSDGAVSVSKVPYGAEGQGSALYSFPADAAYRFMQ